MKNKALRSPHPVSGRASMIGIAFVMIIVGGLVADASRSEGDNFYANIIRLEQIITRVHQNYVEDVPSTKLVDEAVKGMLGVLDPHTSYFEQKDFENLRIHTEGKFGGLGIQISIRDKILTVMTPIAGTPASRAGIQSGDQILRIDGKSTKGITIDAAVEKLRGAPGSEVTITIRRRGEKKDLDYTITREIIRIRSIPFAGVLDSGIGYIRLLTFSQDAGDDVEKAIRELLKQDIEGLILDLRHNPGGLLPQAISVAEKFLPRRSLVVSTRGRVRGQNREFEARTEPVLPDDIPLVVLVNAASASASEIVAGAIQDWDRGVVLGDTTFGKGSVQSILPLDKTHHLKLTTALYYTPSGRSINKPENHARSGEDDGDDGNDSDDSTADKEIGDDEEEDVRDSSVAVDATVYRTRNGRVVYGGGGIIPDSIILEEPPPFVIRALFGKDVFFKFATNEYPSIKGTKTVIGADYVVGNEVMEHFYAYLDSIDFDLQSYTQAKFDEFRKLAGFKESSDTASGGGDQVLELLDDEREAMARSVGELQRLLGGVNRRLMRDADAEIRKHVTQAILVRELGQDHEIVYRSRLGDDIQVNSALHLLKEPWLHAALLTPKVPRERE